jgi:hypothetical protein
MGHQALPAKLRQTQKTAGLFRFESCRLTDGAGPSLGCIDGEADGLCGPPIQLVWSLIDAHCGNPRDLAGCESFTPVLPRRRGRAGSCSVPRISRVGASKIRVFGLRSVATTRDCFEREIVAATDQAISGVPGGTQLSSWPEANSVDKVAGDSRFKC